MPDYLECKIRKNSPYTLKNEQKVSCWWSTQGHLGAVFLYAKSYAWLCVGRIRYFLLYKFTKQEGWDL